MQELRGHGDVLGAGNSGRTMGVTLMENGVVVAHGTVLGKQE